MILDYLQQLARSLAITATGLATNVIDMSEVGAHQNTEFGSGEPMGVMVSVDVASDYTTGDESYVFTVESSAATGITSADVLATKTLPLTGTGSIAAGTRFFLPIPPNVLLKRYLGLRATLGGTTPSITYSAYLMTETQFTNLSPSYTSGFTVL